MSRLTAEQRDRLLQDLSDMGSKGSAEVESAATFKNTFYPVSEHTRAFDPDVVLIVGERGAGKSELFRAVVREGLLPAIARLTPGSRLAMLSPENTRWLAGHPLGVDFADASGLQRFIAPQAKEPAAAADLWFAYLVRILKDEIDTEAQQSLRRLISLQGGDIESIFQQFRQAGSLPLLALDRLDESLKQTGRWVFVSYDELDTLGGYDWKTMASAIRGLVDFWANYARRWQRIRAKIFLRTDLFRRHTQALGADLIKLAANRAELSWSDRNLYAMLIKRVANTSDRLRDYCQAAGLHFKADETLGLVPVLEKAEDARPFIERMAGPYMGANRQKGRTFTWLLDHIRDGHKKVVPRALVRLVEEAAAQERESPRATHNRLLSPRSLRRAIDVVSKEHVLQVNTRELPWLPGVAYRLKDAEVPMRRRETEHLFDKDWEQSWGQEAQIIRPPVEEVRELVDYLVEIGILRLRTNGEIDVPDLFLAGLGLKRRGGVKKK
jgi:hypothetical protein